MKKIISIFLSLTILLSLSVTFSAADQKVTFANINDVQTKITKIFNDKFNCFHKLSHKLRPSISENDKYFNYDMNCGPCSTAFQKILYKNGIVTEIQRPVITRDHVYNLLRTSYTSSPDVETDIVIDTTYKQFLTSAYTSAEYTFDDMANELPNVLIYEYGNYEQLENQLFSTLKNRFNKEKATDLINAVYDSHYYFEYLPNDLQYLNNYDNAIKFSSEFIEDLRNTTANFSVQLDDTPVLNSTTSDLQKEFVYDANGVYRCLLSNAEITEFAKGFTIKNQSNDTIYGAGKNGTTLGAVVYSYMTTNNYLRMLDKNSIEPMTISTNQLYGNAVMSIDLGSGIDTPTVYIIPLTISYFYGDVNKDGKVDITDVTYLQESIVGNENYKLDAMQKSIADVTKTGTLNINNATAISNKLAENSDFEYGEKLYFSHSLYLGFSGDGYIDF